MNRRMNVLLILFLLALVSCAGPTPAPSPYPGPELVTDAALEAECSERLILYDSPMGLPILREIPQIGAYVVCQDSVSDSTLLENAERDEVRQWLPGDEVGDAIGALADPWPQWHLETMQAEEAWPLSTGQGVTVYVLDTAGNCGQMQMTHCGPGKNYVGGSASDGHGHGSHVGSTIGEAFNGQRGVGVAHGVTVSFYKVLSDSGSGSTSGIGAAISDAADDCPAPGRCIISMSLGSSQRSTVLDRAIDYATSKRTVVIAAAGNHGTTAPGYPGCSPGVIGIGATDSNDRRASFSAYGSCIDLAAPGVNITASRPDGSPWTISGTSMATPNVSAVAALMLARGARPDDIEQLLEETADDIGGQGLGAGRVNALRAVQAVDPSPPPTNAPAPTPDKTENAPVPATVVPPVTSEPPREACTGIALLSNLRGGWEPGLVLVPCPDGS